MQFNLFELIDRAGITGGIGMTIRKGWLTDLEPGTRTEQTRELLLNVLYGLHPFTMRFDHVAKWVKEVEAWAKREEDDGWTLRFNVAKLLYLPCEKPTEELAQMRAFLEAMKPFFEEHAGKAARLSIQNNRDRNGKVYGELFLSAGDSPEAKASCEAHKARLDALIEASPALQHMLRTAALTLQKLGPWSWVNFTEDMLYPPGTGPSFELARKQLTQEH